MRRRFKRFPPHRFALAAVLLLATPFPAASQPASPPAGQPASQPDDETWTPPRTADGRPDLQGVWANNSATPLERPTQLEGKESFTAEELADLQAAATRLFGGAGDAAFADGVFQAALADVTENVSGDGGTGNYSSVWMVDRDFDARTSLITDPSHGRLPALTRAATDRRAVALAHRQQHPYDGAENLPLQVRCITYGIPRVGGLGAGYNSYFQIFQTADHLVMLGEMIHDARVIPISDHAHIDPEIRQWHGDARGRWEGDVLVVETINFGPKSTYRGSSENLHLVERFTRVGPAALHYEIAVTDPTTWTAPWTALVVLKESDDAVFEYACHEGNYGMEGILTGARAEEAGAEPDRR